MEDTLYQRKIPAPPVHEGVDRTKGEIFASVQLHNILGIQEVQSKLSLQFMLQMTWRDPRLTFKNLKQREALNLLSAADSKRIWKPAAIFNNTREKLEVKVYTISP